VSRTSAAQQWCTGGEHFDLLLRQPLLALLLLPTFSTFQSCSRFLLQANTTAVRNCRRSTVPQLSFLQQECLPPTCCTDGERLHKPARMQHVDTAAK
jgi:hypothetical protein